MCCLGFFLNLVMVFDSVVDSDGVSVLWCLGWFSVRIVIGLCLLINNFDIFLYFDMLGCELIVVLVEWLVCLFGLFFEYFYKV